jgi:hypothetical protein
MMCLVHVRLKSLSVRILGPKQSSVNSKRAVQANSQFYPSSHVRAHTAMQTPDASKQPVFPATERSREDKTLILCSMYRNWSVLCAEHGLIRGLHVYRSNSNSFLHVVVFHRSWGGLATRHMSIWKLGLECFYTVREVPLTWRNLCSSTGQWAWALCWAMQSLIIPPI